MIDRQEWLLIDAIWLSKKREINCQYAVLINDYLDDHDPVTNPWDFKFEYNSGNGEHFCNYPSHVVEVIWIPGY